MVARAGAVGAASIPEDQHYRTEPVVTWIRSWEAGNILSQTVAKVVEFLFVVGCLFSIILIPVCINAAMEYGLQEAADVIPAPADAGVDVAGLEADRDRLADRVVALEDGQRVANQRAAAADGREVIANRARDAAQAAALAANNARDTANTAKNKAERQVTDLTAQVTALTAERDKAVADAAKAGDAGGQVNELQKANQDLQRQLQETRTKAGHHEDGLNAKIAGLQKTVADQDTALSKAAKDAGGITAQLREQLQTAQGQIRTLTTENGNLQNAVQDTKAALETMTAKANNAEGRIATMVDKADAERTRADLQANLNIANGRVTTLETQIGKMTDKDAAADALAKETARANAAESTLREKAVQFRDLQASVEEFTKNRLDAAQANTDLQAQIKALNARLGKMTDKDKADKALKAATDEIQGLNEKITKLGQMVPKQQLDDLQKLYQKAQAALEKRAITPADMQALTDKLTAAYADGAATKDRLEKELTTYKQQATAAYNQKMNFCANLTPAKVKEMQQDAATWRMNWADLDLDKVVESQGNPNPSKITGGANNASNASNNAGTPGKKPGKAKAESKS